jgi:hypothetical protein
MTFRETTVRLWARIELEKCEAGQLPESEGPLNVEEVLEVAKNIDLPNEGRGDSWSKLCHTMHAIRPDLTDTIKSCTDIEQVPNINLIILNCYCSS